jgi:formamidopyrimidine-DNA glycosylase
VPELPEVEVTRKQLEPLITGRSLSGVDTSIASHFFITDPTVLRTALIGRKILALERRGKYLVLHFENSSKLLLHLGMTGQLFCAGTANPRLFLRKRLNAYRDKASILDFEPDSHTHLVLHFLDRGPSLYFRDVRRFGKVELIKPRQKCARLEKLGVDALRVTAEQLYQITRQRKRAIKSLLLEQSLIAGIGNIYADEALFVAGIRPTKRANALSKKQSQSIVDAIRGVMQRSIDKGGSSISTFLQPNGRDGEYQRESLVYARANEPCRRCATPIKRIVLGQRSTHYCPRCQR